MLTKICKQCNKEFETKDKRSKFCSRSCSASYNNSLREDISDDQRKKISDRLKKYWKENPDKIRRGEKAAKAIINSTRGRFRETCPESILSLSKRTTSKVLKRLNLSCSRCGWNKDTCDIHHIIPKASGGSDNHSNLTYLCPNCHRLAQNGKIKEKLITIEDQFGDAWKNKYYG